MESQTKVVGGCFKNGKLHKLHVVTVSKILIEEWENLPEREVWGQNRKIKWGKYTLIGQIGFNGLRRKWAGQLNFSLKEKKYLELWIQPWLAKEWLGLEIPAEIPKDFCRDCLRRKGKEERKR